MSTNFNRIPNRPGRWVFTVEFTHSIEFITVDVVDVDGCLKYTSTVDGELTPVHKWNFNWWGPAEYWDAMRYRDFDIWPRAHSKPDAEGLWWRATYEDGKWRALRCRVVAMKHGLFWVWGTSEEPVFYVADDGRWLGKVS